MDLSHRAYATMAAVLAALFLTLAAPHDASAFCGFYVSGAQGNLYNDATMVSLMRQGKRTVLAMQNNYQGPPEDFAIVVPVPVVLDKQQVKTLPGGVFQRLDKLTAPRLVEYWERDPCYRPPRRHMYEDRVMMAPQAAPTGAARPTKKGKVTVHARFKVGEYDIVVLSSTESTALEDWLHQHKYNIPKGAAPYFKPYIENGQYFFVAKVDVNKVKFDADGEAKLSPLRFYYDTDDFVLPVRLGLINSKGAQDLIVFVLAKGQRYEVADYPNVTIPTNIVVNDDVKQSFGGFYNELFNTVLKEHPKAVVTEYSWMTSTCDPCPGPPLSPSDIVTLGGDVINPRPSNAPAPGVPGQTRRGGARPMPVMPRRSAYGWVVTRLHARYTKDTLGKDLVFKAAPPIVGGRGVPQGADGVIAQKGAQPSGTNNFQGRYIMLHHWKGDVDCASPRRGVWGGPNGQGQASSRAANNLAFDKPTAKLALAKYVSDDKVPGLAQPVANYSTPIGNVFVNADGSTTNPPHGGDGGGSKKTEDNKDQTPKNEQALHPRGSAGGGCASSSGAKESSVAFLMMLLALGGLGRIWRRR